MEKLLNAREVDLFRMAIARCKGDVYLIKNDQSEEFNLKSTISEYIAIDRLIEEHGNEYELFCTKPGDQTYMFDFFAQLKQSRANAAAFNAYASK